jgi:hypothetical protein
VLGALAAGAVLLVAFVARSARHPAPVIELGLFRVRSFAVANGGVFAFALGFYALLLGNVLFLTQVWGWSVLEAGVALTPGPLMAAVTAPLAARSPTDTASASWPCRAACSAPPAAPSSRSRSTRRPTTSPSSCPRWRSPAAASG